MDAILKGILMSSHPDNVKKQLMEKVASQGSSPHPVSVISSVLQLMSQVYIEGQSEFERNQALYVYINWAKYNMTVFEEFFSKDLLLVLLSKKYKSEPNAVSLIHYAFRLLQPTLGITNYMMIVEAKAVEYVREHPYMPCLKNFADLLMEFKDCIPKGNITSGFCSSLIHAMSLCGPPEDEKHILGYIKDANTVASLLDHIWRNMDSTGITSSLQVIFRIISSNEDLEPSLCLGSLVPYIPLHLIDQMVNNAIQSDAIDNKSMTFALQRMIDWLQWPTARFVDHWVVGFLKGLASVQKYSILIEVTESKIEQIFEKLQFAPVRESGLNIASHMLQSFQHSPDPFHKVLPLVPDILHKLKLENTDHSRSCAERLAELIHILMYLHAGFPDLYDPIVEVIKDYPAPSFEVITLKLTQSKWTTHRAGLASTSKIAQKFEMGKTGLFNLGNTCYMNSIVQAIYMCDSFRQDVLGHTPTQSQNLVVKLQHVFAFLSHSMRPSYAPMTFLRAANPPWFSAGFQQDCSEFLKHLLDHLHEQEEKSSGTSLNPDATKETGRKSPTEKSIQPKQTLIEKNFGGKMVTTVKCLNCGTESSQSEMFTDIPLAFPEYHATSHKSLAGGSATPQKREPVQKTVINQMESEPLKYLHLSDLLSQYLKPEKLSDDNRYYSLKLWKTPEYLILTLLRFSYDTKTHSRSKIFREVKYPKTLLVPKKDDRIISESKREPRRSLRSFVSSRLEQCGVNVDIDHADVYGLYCGHYYCYARHSVVANPDQVCDNIQECSNEDEIDFLQDKWYMFNDSRVSYASYSSFCNVTQRFSKDTAYVLIYRKVDADNIEIGQTDQNKLQIDLPLRADLRDAVNKDNKLFLQEQESSARKTNRKRANPSSTANSKSWYYWKKDDDDDNNSPNCGGGGGLGDLDTSGARFVF
ncbi:hypothetical protein ACJMK2_032080 [Sinanodonta woodiana]|uniref:USP domain-containing protein n=1 Tax=Sinanodonta woodiana TaxID=1069815 RepID=A0ABD3X0N6_SINWO